MGRIIARSANIDINSDLQFPMVYLRLLLKENV